MTRPRDEREEAAEEVATSYWGLTPEERERADRDEEERRNAEAIQEIVARAPRMTAEQAARIRRIFKYLPSPDEPPGYDEAGRYIGPE